MIEILLACVLADGPSDDPPAVIGGPALSRFWLAAGARRVDIVMCGDSNQLFGGHGWDHGWGKAATDRFGMYATGVLHAGENSGNGGQTGYQYNVYFHGGPTGPFSYSGAPPELDRYMNQPAWSTTYLYLPAGGVLAGNYGSGMGIGSGCPVDPNGNLRWHFTYATFPGIPPAAPGTFLPTIRRDVPPYDVIAQAPWVNCVTGSYGVATHTMDLPAAPRGFQINFRLSPTTSEPSLYGPLLGFYHRVENLDRGKGASEQTFWGVGGRSTRYQVERMLAMSDDALTLYFQHVRALQGPPGAPRFVLVRICQGLNDRNELLPSLGPGHVEPGNSAEAFLDNTQAAIDRFRSIWTLNAWPAEELYFLITPSHPVSNPDDPQLVGFRDAAETLAASNARTAVVRLDRITNHDEMLALGFYNSGGLDVHHLTLNGFVELSRRELAALVAAGCPVDLNADGEVDFSDIEAFVMLYAAGSTQADFNFDTEVDFSDIEVFLALYGPGC